MDKIKQDVFESLDNAIENGYELLEWEPEDISKDLHEYDSQFENVSQEILLPIVKEWYETNKFGIAPRRS